MDDMIYEFEPEFDRLYHYYEPPLPVHNSYPLYVTHLFITGLMSTSVIGQGLIWNENSTTALGSTSFAGNFGERDVAGLCCDGCSSDFPDTIMFNYDHELSECFCLKARPGKTPTTKAPYVLDECPPRYIDPAGSWPGTPLALFTPESVDLKGEVSYVGDSSQCCEECKKVHTDADLFAYVNNVEAANDKACMCYGKKHNIKPVSSPSNFYAGVCGLTSTCMATPYRPDLHGNPSKGDKKCVFPFTFAGVIYYSCAPGMPGMPADSLWCATKVDESGKLVLGEWGYCSQGCP